MTSEWFVSGPGEPVEAGAAGVAGSGVTVKIPALMGGARRDGHARAQVLALCSEMDQGQWGASMVAMMDEDCRLLMQDLGL